MSVVGLYCESHALLQDIETAFETARLKVWSDGGDGERLSAGECLIQVLDGLEGLAEGKGLRTSHVSFLILACRDIRETFAEAEKLWRGIPSLSIICVVRQPEEVFAALPYPFFHVVREFSLEQDLRAVMQKIQRAGSLLPKWCTFQGKNELVRVKLKEILYLESDRHQIRVHMENKKESRAYGEEGDCFGIAETLSGCEERLKASGFARIHKSFLVNLYHVSKLGKEKLVLDCGTQLYISRHRYGEIKFQFESYIRHMDFL